MATATSAALGVRAERPHLGEKDLGAAAERAYEDMARSGATQPLDLTSASLELRRIREGGVQHLLLGEAARAIRVDLLGYVDPTTPAILVWHLSGFETLTPQLETLRNLTLLCETREPAASTPAVRVTRQVMLLRCADALSAGADMQAIARGLFGALVPEARWRNEAASVRLRVQRLVAGARMALAISPSARLAYVHRRRGGAAA